MFFSPGNKRRAYACLKFLLPVWLLSSVLFSVVPWSFSPLVPRSPIFHLLALQWPSANIGGYRWIPLDTAGYHLKRGMPLSPGPFSNEVPSTAIYSYLQLSTPKNAVCAGPLVLAPQSLLRLWHLSY